MKAASPPRQFALLTLLGAALLSGCAAVPAYEQGKVSKPGMTFSDSAVESHRVGVVGQIETGSSASGGAQAAGCSACR